MQQRAYAIQFGELPAESDRGDSFQFNDTWIDFDREPALVAHGSPKALVQAYLLENGSPYGLDALIAKVVPVAYRDTFTPGENVRLRASVDGEPIYLTVKGLRFEEVA